MDYFSVVVMVLEPIFVVQLPKPWGNVNGGLMEFET
jgi:hypothetical protein